MRHFLESLTLALVLLLFWPYFSISAPEKHYTHAVIFSEIPLPGHNVSLKQKAVDTINPRPDVDTAVGLGDICQDLGKVTLNSWL